MALSRERGGDFDLDVSAFSDIAFLLIIFFILTTTYIKPAADRMEIPSGEQSAEQTDAKDLTVNLAKDQIRFGAKADPVTLDELRDALLKQDFPNKEPNKRIVILDCGADVPYQLYFDVVVTITEAGGVMTLIDEEGEKK